MINGLWGRPRSGKSYEAVRYHIIPALLKRQTYKKDNDEHETIGRMVVTNIPINIEKVRQIYGDEAANLIVIVKTEFNDYGNVRPFSVPDDFTKHGWSNELGQGPLFIIDEAHLSVGRDCKKEVREYYSMHGHYGHDIILLSQDPAKIHKDIKSMVEVSWRCIKKSVYGDNDSYIKKTYHGVAARNADFVHEEERKYDSHYFPFYQSHTQSSVPVDEAVHQDIKGSLMPGKWRFITLIVVGIFISLYFGAQMFSVKHEQVKLSVTNPVVVETKKVKEVKKEKEAREGSFTTYKNGRIVNNDKIFDNTRLNSKEYHPYYKVDLFISGWHDAAADRVYFFSAKKDAREVFSLRLSDLYQAGYDVFVISDCSIRLRFYDYEDYINCDLSSDEEYARNVDDNNVF